MKRIEVANQRLKRLGVIGRKRKGTYKKRAKTKELASHPMYLRDNKSKCGEFGWLVSSTILIREIMWGYMSQSCHQDSLQG